MVEILLATHYAISPWRFDAPGLEFGDIDLQLEDRRFRLTIQTREHTEGFEEPFTDILIVALGVENPSAEVLLAFTNPERFKPQQLVAGDLEDTFNTPMPQFPKGY